MEFNKDDDGRRKMWTRNSHRELEFEIVMNKRNDKFGVQPCKEKICVFLKTQLSLCSSVSVMGVSPLDL